MTNGFPKHIEKALDSYQSPALSIGFADRVVEAALNQPLGSQARQSILPWNRRRMINRGPWKRGGYVASGLLGFGLVSAAAAAALSIADLPVRIPIMSDLVERVLPEAPNSQKSSPLQKAATTTLKPATDIDSLEPKSVEAEAFKKRWQDMDRREKRALVTEAVRKNEDRLQERRIRQGLAPLTEKQLSRRRAAIRRNIANGKIPRSAIRKSIRREAIRQRLEVKQTNGALPVAINDQPAPAKRSSGNESVIDQQETSTLENDEESAENDSDSMAETKSDGVQSDPQASGTLLTPQIKAKLKENLPAAAKQRLRQASPAERQQILRQLRERRKNMQNRRQARQRLREIRNRTK